jgi:polyisoprenoid-binding protein YceI
MKRIVLIAIATAVVLAGGAYGAFAIFSGGGGPEPAALSSAEPQGATGDLSGTWTVDTAESFVGYRVREKLAFLPAPNDAVGRADAVEGTLQISGLTVESVDVTADLRDLESDRDMRDNRLRELGLETDQFPEARFELTEPITFDARPEAGRQIERSASGRLTLHGVTRDVTVPLQAQWGEDRIEVVGSLEVQFSDYDIEQIRLNQVTTEDHGTMEFQLVFVPSEQS